MIVNSDTKVKEVLKINERMLDAFVWLAPEFERLRNPVMRKAMAGRVSVEQAAKIARVPVREALYLLNLAAGEDEKKLATELCLMSREGRLASQNTEPRPAELNRLSDDDPRIHFVDVLPLSDENLDPRPAIMHGLTELRSSTDVLLVRHRFDPIPLRDLFKRRGFASWAEERRRNEWYIYFYRPGVRAGEAVHRPASVGALFRTASAGS